ncbi:N-succinylglutamate 5-semialdehyde dehydrogenase [Striga asiatica]|uniref:N-succinylglutamate 5-semialdehyde dehydrogenase n=1 Tax=Striga asiatica TaxID=4170 RepID=A0A5A7Q2J2_STRAF|nr:N-succinylglutamate 5-semialdehyde dehydrogenase [Striga asiatica]
MPRLSAAITQDECLYDDRWTKEANNLFIDLLMEANSVGDWKYGRPANSVFDYCRLGIKAALDLNFSLCDVELRFDFLHKRYSVFSWMLRKHGLRHCVKSNVLTAPVAVWDDIFEVLLMNLSYALLVFCLNWTFQKMFKTESTINLSIWNVVKALWPIPTHSVWPINIVAILVGMSLNCAIFPDFHSTNEHVVPALIDTSDLLSEPSNNNVVIQCPTANSFNRGMGPRERDVSSECSVNTQSYFLNPTRGSLTPMRIPRPPRKSAPSSCKGSSSDPRI